MKPLYALLLFTAVAVAIGQVALPNPRAEKMEALQIIDAEGRVRMFLGTTNRGAGIWIQDEHGVTRATLSQAADGVNFGMNTKDGTLALRIALREDGDAQILLVESQPNAAQGDVRAILHLDPKRNEILASMTGPPNTTGFFATADAMGSSVDINPAAGARVRLLAPTQGVPTIDFLDSQQASIGSVP